MKMRLLLTAIWVVAPGLVLAQTPSDESIDRLLKATRAERIIETLPTQLRTLADAVIKQQTQGKALSAEEQRRVDAANAKLNEFMARELTWESFRGDYFEVYRSVFTQAEIDGLIAFYESPAGQTYTAKMPVAIQKSMELTRRRLGPLMQQLQRELQEAVRPQPAPL